MDDVEQFRSGHVVIGIDTHKHIHVAAVMDSVGGILATLTIATDAAGFKQLLEWAAGFGKINALAETVNGYYKTELVRGPARPGPWRTVEDLELATLGWVHWHNTQRLHGYLGDIPPAEFEQTFYADQTTPTQLVGIK